jgi:myxalamid-type polyketide synthase MxaE and MxaD
VRDGHRFALRLVPAPLGPAPVAGDRWRADAAYLITGGLGGVALEIAASMVRDGARRLVLVGRSPMPPRSEWAGIDESSQLGRRVRAVRALEHTGASVHLIEADVADEAAVQTALDAYAAEGWPPIAGVIHAAVVVDSRLTADMDRKTFERGLAAKLRGAVILDRLLPELDLFVVFSSFFSFWGAAGMANYAAANAGLDALAQARRNRGQHALSIQWGAWANVGLHTLDSAARTLADLERYGLRTFTAEEGRECFGPLLGFADPVVAVLPIDWATFRQAGPMRDSALFRDAPGAGENLSLLADGALERLREASPVERRTILERIVRETLGAVLRLPAAQLDARRPFGSLGLDSLMALELRNRLEVALALRLPASLAWNYSTVEALTAHLEVLVAPEPAVNGEATTTAPTEQRPSASDDGDLSRLLSDADALSDDEAVRLLRGVG